jgi:hypothetical protein
MVHRKLSSHGPDGAGCSALTVARTITATICKKARCAKDSSDAVSSIDTYRNARAAGSGFATEGVLASDEVTLPRFALSL